MKTRLFTRLPGMTLAGLLTLTGVGVLGFGPEAHAGGGGTLEGTWLNAVKIVTCPPAPHVVIAAFQSMNTYYARRHTDRRRRPGHSASGGLAQCRVRHMGAHGPAHLSHILPLPQF